MLPICILAIRDDDDRAYMTRLFVKYQRLMYRTIYDILGDKWATEDVLQTTLLRLIDHLDTLRRLEPEGLAGSGCPSRRWPPASPRSCPYSPGSPSAGCCPGPRPSR